MTAGSPSSSSRLPTSAAVNWRSARRLVSRTGPTQRILARPGPPGNAVSARSAAAAGEIERLPGERQPRLLGLRVEAEPLLHRGALVRVEADALPRGDQRVHPAGGQFQHETPPDQHHEDLFLEADRAAAEPAAALRRRDSRGPDQLVDQVLITPLGLRPLIHPPRLDLAPPPSPQALDHVCGGLMSRMRSQR